MGRALLNVLNGVLWFIGLAGVPDDVVTWNDWLKPVMPYIDSPLGRIGMIILGLVMFYLVNWWRKPTVSRHISPDHQPQSPNAIPFEPKRTGLDELRDEIKNAAIVKALWLVGDQADQHNIFATGKPQHLILLDPDGSYLPYHSKLFTKSVGEVIPVIEAVTTRAIRQGVKVEHFDGPIFFTLTIFDPDSANGYIRVELPIPGSAVHERPSMIVRKSQYPETFQSLLHMFAKISTLSNESAESQSNRPLTEK